MKLPQLLLLGIFAFFILLSVPVAHAQDSIMIPGSDCGIPGAPDGKDKCCYSKFEMSIPDFPIPMPFGIDESLNKARVGIAQIKQTAAQNQTPCAFGEPTSTDSSSSSCTCKISASSSATEVKPFTELCGKYFKTSSEKTACESCSQSGGYWSAFGCIPLKVETLVTDFILRTGIGFAGVISTLCIIYAAFTMQTSRANPEKIKKAQDMLTSCIMGLVLIIFSVFILRFIGVSVLQLPGFS